MITIDQYTGTYDDCDDWTPERQRNAAVLLRRVNELMQHMQNKGVAFIKNPATDSQVGGGGNGGFRPQTCAVGAANSAHKEGQAVDIYDPKGIIDAWLLANDHVLTEFDLYIEHPNATPTWSHWSTRKPGSGARVFYP